MTDFYVISKIHASHPAYGSTTSTYVRVPKMKILVQGPKVGDPVNPPPILNTLWAAGSPTASSVTGWSWNKPGLVIKIPFGGSIEFQMVYAQNPVSSKRIYEAHIRSLSINKPAFQIYMLQDAANIDATSGNLSVELMRTDKDPNPMSSSATSSAPTSAATSAADASSSISTASTASPRAALMQMLKRADSMSATPSSSPNVGISLAAKDPVYGGSASSSSNAGQPLASGPKLSTLTSTSSAALSPSSSASPSATISSSLFKLDYFLHQDAHNTSNPWAAKTPSLKPAATAPSNSLAIISRTSTILVKDKKKTVDEKLPPKLKTMDLPLGLSQLQLLRVATSAFGAIAIAEDGSLLYWTRSSGNDSFVEGGPVPGFAGSVIIDIAAGHDHFLALTMDGFLYAWGANQYHQCSTESIHHVEAPVKVSSKLIIACAAGGHSSMCIDTHGVVYTWGRASTSLTVPVTHPIIKESSNTSQSSNTSVAPSNATSAVSAHPSTSTARPSTRITHRTIIVDSLSHGGELASSRSDPRYVSELTSIWLPEDLSFTQASMSSTMSVLVARDGSVWAWGDANATCGSSVDSISLTPVRVPFPKGVRIVRALAGDIHALALDSTGKLWSWGNRFVGGQLSLDAPTSAAPIPVVLNGSSKDSEGSAQEVVIDFGISENESCAVTASSDVYVWKNFGPFEKVETLGGDLATVGVSHGPSSPAAMFIIGGAKTTPGHSQQASQIYSMEDDDGYDNDIADDYESGTASETGA